jgi:hypothetical protein
MMVKENKVLRHYSLMMLEKMDEKHVNATRLDDVGFERVKMHDDSKMLSYFGCP